MRQIEIYELHVAGTAPSGPEVLATRVTIARSLRARMIGLLGRRELEAGGGLWIEPCLQVHTFGMRLPIDVVHLDARRAVLAVQENLRPWRIGMWVRGTRSVIELPAGTVGRHGGLRRGQSIERVLRAGTAAPPPPFCGLISE